MESPYSLWILLLMVAVTVVKSDDDCLYTFENDSEMEDFDSKCDGTKGEWKIADLPTGAPATFGKRALTIREQSMGCLKSSKRLTLNSTTKVLTKFYWKKAQWGSATFKIKFLSNNLFCGNNVQCQQDLSKASCLNNKDCEWDIGQKYDSVVEERWVEEEFNVFKLPGIQDYEMQIELYLNSATVLIDSITILDILGNSDQCYLNPRTTTTTTDITTTTTSDITTTTEMPTTTTSEATTTTDLSSTTTTDETTTISTTTSEETTLTSTETTNPPSTTSSTTDFTTTSEVSTTTIEITTTTANFITSTTTEAFTTNEFTTNDPTTTSTSDIGTTLSDQTSTITGSSKSSTVSSWIITTDRPSAGNCSKGLGDCYYPLKIILVVISIIVIIFFCSAMIWFRRRRRKIRKNDIDIIISPPSPIAADKIRKTDLEYYYEVNKEWNSISRGQRR